MSGYPTPTMVRPYRVTRKVRESETITSFYLEPADGMQLAPFEPGQFLTVRLEGVARCGTIWRNYSLSGSPAWMDTYRITVKREPAAPGHRAGLGSGYLHDQVSVGDLLWARGPEGRFVLDATSGRPVVLLSGGVGLTPLVAMAHALAREGRCRGWFIHACDNGAVHAMGAEISALAAGSENLSVHVCYRTPGQGDRIGTDFDSSGIVTQELLQSLLPLDDYDFYICGPSTFMQAVHGHLLSLGVRVDRIRQESFDRAAAPVRPVRVAKTETAEAAPKQCVQDGPVVRFSIAGIEAPWDPAYANLLDFAEGQGLAPLFSCRAGICSTCMCNLAEGEVDYPVEPLELPPQGKLLICCAIPRSDVTIEL